MSNPNPHRPRASEQRSGHTAVKSTNRAPPEVGQNPQGFRTRQPGHLRAIKTPSSQDFVNILRTGSVSVAHIVSRLAPRYDEQPTGPLLSAAEQARSRLKTLQPRPPLWKEQDEVQEEIVLSNKRSREQGGFEQTSAPRMSIARRAQRKTVRIVDEEPHRISKKTYLGPEMSLMCDGEVLDDSDVEMHEELPQVGRKTTKMVVPRVKSLVPRRAARKTHIDTSSSSSAFSDDEEPDTSSGDDSSDNDEDTMEGEVDHDFRVKQEEGEEAPRPFGPAELVDLCSPPKITIPLPQISHRPPAPPTSTLIALERLTLHTTRMQEAKQLPFLVRSLRKGFLLRCRDLGKDWKVKSRKVTLHLRYEGSNNEVIESKVTSWRCPLCSLHGVFPARRPLELHVQWDHNEVTAAWTFQNDNSWLLRIALYNTIPEDSDSDIGLPVSSRIKLEPKEEELDFGNTTMFPFVEVSPPSSPALSSTRASLSTDPPSSDTLSSGATATPRRDTEGIQRDFPTLPLTATKYPSRFPLYKQPESTSATSTRDSLTTTSSLSQHRSTGREETVSRSSLLSTSTNDTARPAHVATVGLRYPTPPPPDDPFGPSARPPYLPARSDYGGPTVYYSCRPTGPSLLDLLGTLPMDEFGVLDWTVTDKEEEIFESDDVKDVHKVMHALWNRWIIINRPAFIADYHKGIIAFVDQYWKMIHRAAGWNALRYWLMLMLANRFLTAKEVAETLKHYEKHTGMEYWANAS